MDSKLPPMSALRIERQGHVLRIALARPERRNAFDAALIAELTQAFADVGDARVGPTGGRGAELLCRSRRGLAACGDRPQLRRERRGRDAAPRHAGGDRLLSRSGRGAGSGPCARRGLRPPGLRRRRDRGGATLCSLSPRCGSGSSRPSSRRSSSPRIGPGAARRYFLTGERFDAATALRIGLVHEVDVRPRRRRRPRARRAPRCRPDGGSRGEAPHPRSAPGVPEVAHRAAERRTSAEGQDGLRAFLEKRRPGGSPKAPSSKPRRDRRAHLSNLRPPRDRDGGRRGSR